MGSRVAVVWLLFDARWRVLLFDARTEFARGALLWTEIELLLSKGGDLLGDRIVIR